MANTRAADGTVSLTLSADVYELIRATVANALNTAQGHAAGIAEGLEAGTYSWRAPFATGLMERHNENAAALSVALAATELQVIDLD